MQGRLQQTILSHITPGIILSLVVAGVLNILPYTGWTLSHTVARITTIVGSIVALVCIFLIIRNEMRLRQTAGADEPKVNVRLDLVKLLHDGKDIQAELKRVQAGSIDQVSAELRFEVWLTAVSNTLKDTEFQTLWYENKIVDYRRDKLPDYIEASGRALERLESILQLASDKEGSEG